MLVVVIVSDPVKVIWDGVWLTLKDLWFSITDPF